MNEAMVPMDQDAVSLDEPAELELRGRRDPLRRCLVTGTVQPKDGMIRFVIGPDNGLVPDVENALPGRGLWVGAERGLIERAAMRNLFAKATRKSVRVGSELTNRVAGLLERRCLDLIGLARRCGQAVTGFDQVKEALQSGRVGRTGVPGVLLAARDGAADGRGKLRALARDLPVVESFESTALAAALGRDHVIHALLAKSALADRLRVEANRLAGLRGDLRIVPVGHGPAGCTIINGPSDTND